MDYKKKLLEARQTDSEVEDFIKRSSDHPFVRTWLKNYEKKLKEAGSGGTEPEVGALKGQTVGDTATAGIQMQVAATLEIFNAVIRGYTRYMDDSWVKRYATDAVVFKIPKVEYAEMAGAISAGELPHSEKRIDYVTIDLSNPESEKGAKVTWTRALLEDVTFDVQAEMMEGLGHAIAVLIQSDLIAKLKDVADNKAHLMPYGAKRTITDANNGGITWKEFLNIVGDVDAGFPRYELVLASGGANVTASCINGKIVLASDNSGFYGVVRQKKSDTVLVIDVPANATLPDEDTAYRVSGQTGTFTTASSNHLISKGRVTYGPADVVLVSPEIYWELLNIIQMTNVLYEGSTDPIRHGVIKLALGCTIIKHGLLPPRTVVALNSDKAIGMVLRRALKIEPVLFPVWNEYGFIGTVRYGASVLFEGAMQWAESS